MLSNSHFNDVVFKNRVEEALKDVNRILDVHRNPRLAADVGHDYTDKYALANTLTNTSIIAQMNVLDRLGLTNNILQKIDPTKPTTLRFQASDSCKFLKEQVVDVPFPITLQSSENTETSGGFSGKTKKSIVKEVVNRIKEFHWEVKVKWELSVYSGANVDERQVLDSRTASTILIVQLANQRAPLPEHRDHKPIEMSLTWLLKQIDVQMSNVHFTIDTQDETTKTPRRNEQVEAALTFNSELEKWMNDVHSHFANRYRHDIIQKHNPAKPSPFSSIVGNSQDLRRLAPESFVPIIPLMGDLESNESQEESTELSSQSVLALPAPNAGDPSNVRVLSANDTTRLLNEQTRSLEKVLASLQTGYPDKQLTDLISVSEATICVLCFHSKELGKAYAESIQYIEKMLEDQLVAAIGKRVTSGDLDQFVKYHNSKMLNPAPLPFCHAIRRPNHYPEGILSIENDTAVDGKPEPIETHVREIEGIAALKFPLNAATTLELTGVVYLHGWLNHRFQSSHTGFKLIGRARQFSSFMLVVGTMAGPDRMQPKDAIILQNKDEINIPLLLNEIPTAKEFKDAIESLSPEQQRFAKAYRSMQLESSVLGVCVIQIKPQLEELLGLPHDALTKEMQLTQELMQLFVDYQVPSDMLSYDGENHEATTKEKVENIKEHVKSVMNVIQESKKKQLENQAMVADMAVEKIFAECDSDVYMTAPSMMGSCAAGNSGMRSMGSWAVPEGSAASVTKRRSAARTSPFDNSMAMMCSLSARSPRFGSMPKAAATVNSASVSTSSQARIDVAADRFPPYSKETVQIMSGGTETPSNQSILDFTLIPKHLDKVIEKHDEDCALRSTTIMTSDEWTRKRQENLLTKPKVTKLSSDEIKSEKDKAFDLLDALSRSGSLPISFSELHVIVCVTHCFEKNVMETVIEDNVNPIEKMEMSTLVMASTVHGVPAQNLISNNSDRMRLVASFPALLEARQDEN